MGTLDQLQRTHCIGRLLDADGRQGMAASAKESDENVTEWDATNDAYQLGNDWQRCGINRCILGVIGVQIKF